jgi:hypothetical protein
MANQDNRERWLRGQGGLVQLLKPVIGHGRNDVIRVDRETGRHYFDENIAKPYFEVSEPARSKEDRPDQQTNAPASDHPSTTADPIAASRRALVETYRDHEFKRTGQRPTRTRIWKAVGYRSRTEFERWERNDPKNPNKSADQRFTDFLTRRQPLK